MYSVLTHYTGVSMSHKRTTAEWTAIASAAHNGKYSYAKTVYVNNNTSLTVTCPDHGDWTTKPYTHMTGRTQCPACAGLDRRKGKAFIASKIHAIHGDSLDLSMVPENATVKHAYPVRCVKHDITYRVKPSDLMYAKSHASNGCPACVSENISASKIKLGGFESRVHHVLKDCNLTLVSMDTHNGSVTGSTNVTFTCPAHGESTKTVRDIAIGRVVVSPCNACGAASRATKAAEKGQARLAALIDGIAGVTVDAAQYHRHNTPITIRCEKHGAFTNKPTYIRANILAGNPTGCPSCGNTASQDEQSIADFIAAHGFEVTRRYRPAWMNRKELDIYVPEANLAIEFNGSVYHSPDGPFGDAHKTTLHYEKWKLCKENGVRLLNIHDFMWISNRTGWMYVILHALGLSERVHARKCTVRQIDPSTARKFMAVHHIEGAGNPSGYAHSYGLFYCDEMVMVIGSSDVYQQRLKTKQRVVSRIATKQGLAVIGGSSKLLKAVGDAVYIVNLDTGGGSADTTKPVTKRYWWVKNGHPEQFLPRNSTQRAKLEARFGESLRPDDTEVTYMVRHGWLRVFGAGTQRQ